DRPGPTAQRLRATGAGCHYLITCWESLRRDLRHHGAWRGWQVRLAVNLLGLDRADWALDERGGDPARAAAAPQPADGKGRREQNIYFVLEEDAFSPKDLDYSEMRIKRMAGEFPERAAARSWLEELMAEEIAALEVLRDCRLEQEERDRALAAERALVD